MKKEREKMTINFIEGEHSDKSLGLCFNYVKQKYIREKILKDSPENEVKDK